MGAAKPIAVIRGQAALVLGKIHHFFMGMQAAAEIQPQQIGSFQRRHPDVRAMLGQGVPDVAIVPINMAQQLLQPGPSLPVRCFRCDISKSVAAIKPQVY